jgi:AcrR family transcriptional regulator
LTVEDVIAACGVGRNTFYREFDDLRGALRAAEQRALGELRARVDTALAASRTPSARVRAFGSAWLTWASANADEALFVLEASGSPRALRRLLEVQLAQLAEEARLAGLVSQRAGTDRVRCLAGSFEACGEHAAHHPDGVLTGATETLSDVFFRTLR